MFGAACPNRGSAETYIEGLALATGIAASGIVPRTRVSSPLAPSPRPESRRHAQASAERSQDSDSGAGGRHRAAQLILSKNAPLLYVSRQLGHSSAAVTLNHYAKWLPGPTERFVDVLDGGSAAVCGSNCGSDEESAVVDVAKSA